MQCTPTTVIHALHPLPVVHNGLTVLPVTFGHCLLLDRLVPAALQFQPLTGFDCWRVLYILSRPQADTLATIQGGQFDDSVAAWALTLPEQNEGVAGVIARSQMVAAFAPLAETALPAHLVGDVETVVSIQPGTGLGWILLRISELCERMSMAEALDFPVCTALALLVAREIRQGCTWNEPTYEDRDRHDAEDAEAELKQEQPVANG